MRTYQKKPTLSAVIKEAEPAPLFELTEEDIEKLSSYAEVVLAVLRVATVLTMIAIAPNALQALDIFERKKYGRKLSYEEKVEKLSHVFHYVKRRSYVDFKRTGDEDFEVKFLKDGKEKVRQISEKLMQIPTHKWDGKFWLVALDVPVKYRKKADNFREDVKTLGLFFLQKTMWFYPFDPRVEIEYFARKNEIERYVTVMRVDELDPEDDETLRKYFKTMSLI